MSQDFLEKLPASLRTIWAASIHWWDDLVMQTVFWS